MNVNILRKDKIKKNKMWLICVAIVFGYVTIFYNTVLAQVAPKCYVQHQSGYEVSTCPLVIPTSGTEKCFNLNGNKYTEMVCPSAVPVQPPNTTTSTQTPPPTNASPGTGSAELDKWLKDIINVLSAIVGLVIVISIIFAGFQYMTARDNAAQVSAAKNRILMAVVSFLLYIFAFAFLQWLIPGGIF